MREPTTNREAPAGVIGTWGHWRTRAVTTAVIAVLGAGLNGRSAEAPPLTTNTAPAEIPEPTSDSPVVKKAKKSKSGSKPPAKQIVVQHPPDASPPAHPPVAQSAERSKTGDASPAEIHSAPAVPPAQASSAQSSQQPGAGQPAAPASTPAAPAPASLSSASANAEKQELPDELAPVRNADRVWHVNLAFDDYRYNTPISEGAGSTESGNLYGVSLSLAAPAWQGRSYFDFSYRQGLLNGDVRYPKTLSSSLQTFINEAFVGFHFESWPWVHNGKERGHLLGYVGVSWDGWSTTETLRSRRKWALNGLSDLTTDQNMILANLGLGYDLVLWNPSSKALSYRVGVRVLGVGAMGGSNYNIRGGEQIDSLAVYALAKGTVYMDLTLHNHVTVFLEGGYQQSWWLFSEVPANNPGVNEFVGYWGGFGRLGFGLSF